MTQSKIVNFRMTPEEYEGLKILSDVTGVTQVDIIRKLVRGELERQKEAIEAYKKVIKTAQAKVKE